MNPPPPGDLADHVATLSPEKRALLERKLKPHGGPDSQSDATPQGEVLEKHLLYWKEQLRNIPSSLELPTDRPRPAIQTFHGAQHSLPLPQSVAEYLRKFSRQESVTLAMTMLAAWQALLYRYTGQDVIVTGLPIVGRQDKETGELIGPFINTLALKTNLSGNPRFKDVVSQVSRGTLEAYDYQDIPFEKVIEELQPERDLRHAPLFQVRFALQNAPHTGLELTGLPPALAVGETAARCDLTLFVVERAGTLAATIEYNTDLFNQETVTRMLGHYQVLLEGIVANPDEPIATLPLLTPSERHQLLIAWNDTKRDYPHNQCVHQLFEAQVERTPDAIAVVYEDQRLTYRELDARANQLAQYLRGLGVGPDTLVGVCLERSLELMVALVGVLKAGGAYVPLDPDYPQDRLASMVQDAHVPVLLTQAALLRVLPASQAQVVCLDRDWERIAHGREAQLVTGVTAENLAYMIYTSGSTGQPKGALNTHRGICNRLTWMQERYQLTATDRVLQKTPYSFDVSVWEFFWPLMTGAGVVFARPRGHQDPRYLVQLITAQQATVLHFVPSMLRIFLEEPNVEQCRSLRQVICSGEALSYELQRRFFSHFEAQLDNLYGPTEAAVDVTYWRCERDDKRGVVPIGRPIANTQIYILDQALQPVPIGVPGELHIGGVPVGRGYLHRPELTAAKFIPDPFSPEPGARLYKTGDLARYLPDGSIEFLGRLDHQVKIRGFRIELGEIEAALRELPGVRDATVIAREYAPGDRRLVAYLVPDHDRPCTDQKFTPSDGGQKSVTPQANPTQLIGDVRDRLQKRLPEYMIPATFMTLENLPLSPNGKVDRKALVALAQAGTPVRQSHAAPRTELEHYLAALWREILKSDKVGIHDKFFEVGGNSLLGALLINKIRQKLGEVIYIVALFEAPTIAQFAGFLSENYASAVAKAFGVTPATIGKKLESNTHSREEKTITAADVTALRQLLPSFEQCLKSNPEERKNPPALFILSTHRSGTTLLRVMLAGHPGLFAVPELQLLGFATLQARKAAFTGKYSLWLEGTMRALMEIKHCGPEEAKREMEEYERRGVTTKEFFRVLQEDIAPRMLVDKTPSYVLDPVALQRAEGYFDRALYIHLVRHPYGMIRSFENFHLNQVLLTGVHHYTGRQFAELVWTVSHQNILDFLAHIPQERHYRMRFEDLTSRPQAVMEEMCATLRLPYHPDLIHPYKDTDKKIMDGLYSESTPMGDPKFQEHGKIDQAVGEAWKEISQEDFLGEVTWEVAEMLGYERTTRPKGRAEEGNSASSEAAPSNRHTLLQRQRELRQSRRATRTER